VRLLLAALAAAGTALAAAGGAITAFSSAAPGASLPAGWRALDVPRVAPARLDLVADEGATVLRVRTQASAGAAAHALRAETAQRPILAWRWKVERVLEGADLRTRAGDDFAARVYVFFDVPADSLPLGARVRMQLARLLHGAELPTAALCYVWDSRAPVGTSAWSPYTDRVRIVVVESGAAKAGRWVAVRRDLEADFRAAFGAAPPAVTGVAAGNDTDQTGERATAWFGDLRLEPRA
jgi:hypothetical protein